MKYFFNLPLTANIAVSAVAMTAVRKQFAVPQHTDTALVI